MNKELIKQIRSELEKICSEEYYKYSFKPCDDCTVSKICSNIENKLNSKYSDCSENLKYTIKVDYIINYNFDGGVTFNIKVV